MKPTKLLRAEIRHLNSDSPLSLPIDKPMEAEPDYWEFPNTTVDVLTEGENTILKLEGIDFGDKDYKCISQLIIEATNDPSNSKANQKKSLGYYRNSWFMVFPKIINKNPLTFQCHRDNYRPKLGKSTRPIRVKI